MSGVFVPTIYLFAPFWIPRAIGESYLKTLKLVFTPAGDFKSLTTTLGSNIVGLKKAPGFSR